MLKFAIPVLHVSSSAAAEEFYCRQLGFEKRFATRMDEKRADPCYMAVERDDVKDADRNSLRFVQEPGAGG